MTHNNHFHYVVSTITTKMTDVECLSSDQQLKDYIKEHDEGYEQIRSECKPYFDYDPKYDTQHEQEAREYGDIQNAINDVKGFTGAELNELCILTASGLHKRSGLWINSVHIIVNNGLTYADGAAQKQEMELNRQMYETNARVAEKMRKQDEREAQEEAAIVAAKKAKDARAEYLTREEDKADNTIKGLIAC